MRGVLVATAWAAPDGYRYTPGGYLLHDSCIVEVANNFVVNDTFPTPCSIPAAAANEQIYAMDTHTQGDVTFTQMNSSWTVPQLPKDAEGQVVYFWPGFKANAPEPGYPVLQPVLQYGQRGAEWQLQSWFVWARTFPPAAITGPAISVAPGDEIVSYMELDESSQIWTVYGRNDRTKETSVLQISKSKAGNTDYKYAMHVLETIMSSSNYCAEYPPDGAVEFTGITVNGGQTVDWQTRVQKSECQQKVAASAKGDDVKMTWSASSDLIV
mmetsp:Transcript_36800/g.88519  ORF Transcript_36800/g.88519 Transcript_36800/m.88519 type:complete len:269 (+) Transcript_36800:63-869(+)